MDQAVAGDALTSDEPYRAVLALCDEVGIRFGGTEGEHQAARLLQQKMEGAGLANVHLEEFSYTGWQRGPASLEVVEPYRRAVPVIGLPYTPPCDLAAEVVSVGQGEEEDFARLAGQLAGKIVLCLAETTPPPGKKSSHRREKYLRAIEAGAVGFLYVSQNPGQQLVTGSLTAAKRAELPAVAVSLEDGADMLRALKRVPVRAHLRVEAAFSEVYSYNVVGDVPGRGGARHIVVGGHYDSHDIAVGAQDNATGTAVSLEVGRLLAPYRGKLPATVRIVCFAGEEIGLLGSWDYAKRHEAELDDLAFMLNLDSIGRARPGAESLRLMGADDLLDYFRGAATAMKYPLGVEIKGSAYSDHFPFVVARIPTGSLTSVEPGSTLVGRGWGHTASDTMDKVEALPLQVAAMLAARLVLRVASDPAWPGRRHTPEELDQLLEAEGLKEYLRKTGRLPFQP
jgi:Zn-dependent M28 family amino/carboxypeptidase